MGETHKPPSRGTIQHLHTNTPTNLKSTLASLLFLVLQPQITHMLLFELIVEILLRLPVKSLLRFRCVCKSWNALISGTEFAEKHLRTSAIMDPTHFFTRHHLILGAPYEPILRDYSLPCIISSSGATASATQREFPPSAAVGSRSSIFGSCHGMLCLRTEQDGALMWNPS